MDTEVKAEEEGGGNQLSQSCREYKLGRWEGLSLEVGSQIWNV